MLGTTFKGKNLKALLIKLHEKKQSGINRRDGKLHAY